MGFQYCHRDLNKDKPSSREGRRQWHELTRNAPADSQNVTLYDLSTRAATAATQWYFNIIKDKVSRAYTPENSNADGACLFKKLVSDWSFPCLALGGSWISEQSALVPATMSVSGNTLTAVTTTDWYCPGDSQTPHRTFLNATLSGSSLLGTAIFCLLNWDAPSQPGSPYCASYLGGYAFPLPVTADVNAPDLKLVLHYHWPGWTDVTDAYGTHRCVQDPSHAFDGTWTLARPAVAQAAILRAPSPDGPEFPTRGSAAVPGPAAKNPSLGSWLSEGKIKEMVPAPRAASLDRPLGTTSRPVSSPPALGARSPVGRTTTSPVAALADHSGGEPTVTLSQAVVRPGQPLSERASNLTANTTATFYVLDASDATINDPAANTSVTSSAGGEAIDNLVVPRGAAQGTYTVMVVESGAAGTKHGETSFVVAQGPERLSVTPHRAAGTGDGRR